MIIHYFKHSYEYCTLFLPHSVNRATLDLQGCHVNVGFCRQCNKLNCVSVIWQSAKMITTIYLTSQKKLSLVVVICKVYCQTEHTPRLQLPVEIALFKNALTTMTSPHKYHHSNWFDFLHSLKHLLNTAGSQTLLSYTDREYPCSPYFMRMHSDWCTKCSFQ